MGLKYQVEVTLNEESGRYVAEMKDYDAWTDEGESREYVIKDVLEVFVELLDSNHFENPFIRRSIPLPSPFEGEDYIEVPDDISRKIIAFNAQLEEEGTGLKYPAWFMKAEGSDAVTVQLADIPACIAEGENMEAAIGEVFEVFSTLLEFTYYENKKPIPFPSLIGEVNPYREKFERTFPVGIVEFSKDLSEKICEHNRKTSMGGNVSFRYGAKYKFATVDAGENWISLGPGEPQEGTVTRDVAIEQLDYFYSALVSKQMKNWWKRGKEKLEIECCWSENLPSSGDETEEKSCGHSILESELESDDPMEEIDARLRKIERFVRVTMPDKRQINAKMLEYAARVAAAGNSIWGERIPGKEVSDMLFEISNFILEDTLDAEKLTAQILTLDSRIEAIEKSIWPYGVPDKYKDMVKHEELCIRLFGKAKSLSEEYCEGKDLEIEEEFYIENERPAEIDAPD